MASKLEFSQIVFDVHSHSADFLNREVYLHSYHGLECDEEPGVEYRMSTIFVKNMNLMMRQNSNPVLVHMHIVGGNWSDGMAAFDVMRFCPFPVSIIVYAQASSMSSIMLQGADVRVLTPNSEFMVHNGSFSISADSITAKSSVDVNEYYRKRMLQIYSRRVKNGEYFQSRQYSESKIKSYLDRKMRDKGDWYLTAEEAVYYGFADGILGEEGYESVKTIKSYPKFTETI